jgi:hypothetical protein
MKKRHTLLTLLCFIFLYSCQSPKQEVKVYHAPGNNKLGAWLWYLHQTGYDSHEQLAFRMSNLGVKRMFIKVADGSKLDRWPELDNCDIPKLYAKHNIEAWAWSYNYPGNEKVQAEALRRAIRAGYTGFVVDIEKEFDGRPEAAEALFKEFYSVLHTSKAEGYTTDSFKLFCTTWGNPIQHNTPIKAIDPYVDAYMPQTYLETWGEEYKENPEYWLTAGNNEYKLSGATKPLHHIIATEQNNISSKIVNTFIRAAGAHTSIWRIPGGGVSTKVWQTWQDIDWDMDFTQPYSCSIMPYDVVNHQYVENEFKINYNGALSKIELRSENEDVYIYQPNASNEYPLHHVCEGDYVLNIYHHRRMSTHLLKVRALRP